MSLPVFGGERQKTILLLYKNYYNNVAVVIGLKL